MKPTTKSLLILIAVFLLGATFGAGLTVTLARQRLAQAMAPDFARRGEVALEMLADKLSLSPLQRDKIAKILDDQMPERRARMQDIMQRCGDPLRAHKRRLDAAIRAVLEPEQQKRFDKIAARQEERLFFGSGPGPGSGRGHGRGQGGPPPPFPAEDE